MRRIGRQHCIICRLLKLPFERVVVSSISLSVLGKSVKLLGVMRADKVYIYFFYLFLI